jgi:hypothetical protein
MKTIKEYFESNCGDAHTVALVMHRDGVQTALWIERAEDGKIMIADNNASVEVDPDNWVIDVVREWCECTESAVPEEWT